MKKIYLLRDLECAHCGARIEAAAGKLAGVSSAKVNFMTQKLVIEAEEAAFPAVEAQLRALVHKMEPDCELVGCGA